MLYKRFSNFVKKKNLVTSNEKVLLAVSGGMDSMTMMYLFKQMGIACEVAHCNFQLRGNDSDSDELLVRNIADSYGFPVFVTRFETLEYAEDKKLSIQMAARELRYTWFKKLAAAHQISKIAIAHNLDDSLETFFINLGRGCGINGLTGIQVENNTIIRPLLFASRFEIEEFVNENNITFREDSSNASDKYLRNKIRHHFIPLATQLFPNFKETLTNNIERLTDVQKIYNASIVDMISNISKSINDDIFINIEQLLQTPAPQTILFEIIKKYGFVTSELGDIMNSISSISGKYFLSTTHKLVRDRECFIISPLKVIQQERFYIEQDTSILSPVYLRVNSFINDDSFRLEKKLQVALFDADKLEFPLWIRKWQMGDYFVPLGMTGMKKLSDFFIDQKMSIHEKENVWLLLSGNQIIWVIGKRIDNRFKISETTQKITRIELID